MKAYPCTALGWSNFYATKFNKTGEKILADMACWLYLRHLAHQDGYFP